MIDTVGMNETFLSKRSIEDCTIEKAIEDAALFSGTALIYTPACCRLGTLDDILNMKDVFEFRCFSPEKELRWARRGSGDTGFAVLLEEAEKPDGETKSHWALPGQYLLWGTASESGEGKSDLFEYRIGRLEVPCSASKGDRVYLEFTEYFEADSYGNLAFYAERLKGLFAKA